MVFGGSGSIDTYGYLEMGFDTTGLLKQKQSVSVVSSEIELGQRICWTAMCQISGLAHKVCVILPGRYRTGAGLLLRKESAAAIVVSKGINQTHPAISKAPPGVSNRVITSVQSPPLCARTRHMAGPQQNLHSG